VANPTRKQSTRKHVSGWNDGDELYRNGANKGLTHGVLTLLPR